MQYTYVRKYRFMETIEMELEYTLSYYVSTVHERKKQTKEKRNKQYAQCTLNILHFHDI